jgi:hypothetical protein
MFTITKVFVALMAVTAVVAAPNKRQTDFTTCEFLMAPDAAPGSIDFDTEFNFGQYLDQDCHRVPFI